MKYLAMALHAEGSTDHRFLEPLIQRAVYECLRQINPRFLIEVAPFVELPPRSRDNEAIVAAVKYALDGIHLFFLHTDGKGRPRQARAERIDPIFEVLEADAVPHRLGCVGVVPVHETEAWSLADPECIREVFGTSRSNAELGLPANPHEVEREPDPKLSLANVSRLVLGARRSRRRRTDYQRYLTALGESIDLERLRRVPAYRDFETDLTAALRALLPVD